jgi:hypothetical protein
VRSLLLFILCSGFFQNQNIRILFADLLRQGGYGRWNTERAAFLVVDESGEYRCVLWPAERGFYRESFRGAMPEGTVAIIHTHPAHLPDASTNDQRTAMRLGIPVFTLTPLNVYLTSADGENVAVVTNRWWAPVSAASSTRCSAPDLRASQRPAN